MYLNENVIFKSRKYGAMLYDVKTEDRMKLNHMATNIFISKYVKKLTNEQIAKFIDSSYETNSYDEILDDVNNVINDIEKSKFMTDNPEKSNYINLLDIEPELDNVIFEVTKKCNLNCMHCLEGGSQLDEELTTEEIFELIDELSMNQVFRVVLTGGEPLMRNDLVDIIKRFTEKKIRTILFTNGTLITNEFLEKIKDCNVLIRFSVDGANAKTHDYIRGEGSFDLTIKAMKLCKDKNIDIGIASTITKMNIEEYLDIVELGKSFNVKEIELSEIIDKGNASLNKELILSTDELEKLRLYNIKMPLENRSFLRGMGLSRYYENRFKEENTKKEYSCNAGISTCFIESNGNVYPCTLFKEFKEFCAGNTKCENITDIWKKSPQLKRLRELKVDKIKSCEGCKLFEACAGGCRARAYASSREIDGPVESEFCKVSKNIFEKMKDEDFFNRR